MPSPEAMKQLTLLLNRADAEAARVRTCDPLKWNPLALVDIVNALTLQVKQLQLEVQKLEGRIASCQTTS